MPLYIFLFLRTINPSDWSVHVGSIRLSGGALFLRVVRIEPHEGYEPNSPSFVNDVAVVKVQGPITFSPNVKPIELDPSEIIYGTFYLSGWGYIDHHETVPDNLQFVTMEGITLQQCQKYFRTKLDTNKMCAISIQAGGCSGDSGGPLIFNDKQIGIVSSGGELCPTGAPAIFSKVSSYYGWIMNKIHY